MGVPEQLEIVALGVTAMLSTWLGLTVAVRAPRQPGARAFSVLSVLLVAWTIAIVVRRMTGEGATVDEPARIVEIGSAFLLPPLVLTLATALTAERQPPGWLRALIVGFWLLSVALALTAVIDPGLEARVNPPHLELFGLSGVFVGWAWIVIRIGIFVSALAWIGVAMANAGPDQARRRQLQVTFLTLLLGIAGGAVRFTPPLSDSDPWIGVGLIALSMVLATYAVFAQGLFFAPDVASRAFRYSAVVGVSVTAYVAVVLAADELVRRVTAVELPIVVALSLVATIALFDPVAARVRRWVAGSDEADPGYDRVLRALGQSVLTAQRPEEAIEPALGRLARALRLTGVEATDRDGGPIARRGSVPGDATGLEMPLERDGRTLGLIRFGAKRSGLPFTPREREVLTMAAGYIAASLELGERHEVQARALELLSVEQAAVTSSGSQLHGALADVSPGPDGTGLHVFALGPLRAERGGELVRNWGGEKAGTRQAEALFAFLFDRGERGVAKDEALELIWPDVDLDRADLAFHRTLGGLRRTLEPSRRRRESSTAIVFHNDRYRLDPSVVAWSDVATFEERLADASSSLDPAASLAALDEARALYRGDYLDDCPFYGDSSHVEDRRELLRGRYVDLLLAIGAHHEARGDRAAAAAAFREARMVAEDECPPAEAALSRLGAT